MKLQLSKRVSPDDLKAHAAAKRYDIEVAGITTDIGQFILTDRESQQLVTSTILYLQNKPPGTVVDFKSTTGIVRVALPDILPLALLIGDHVQNCRSKEAEVITAIEDGTIVTKLQIDEAFAL